MLEEVQLSTSRLQFVVAQPWEGEEDKGIPYLSSATPDTSRHAPSLSPQQHY
jgi:hypothetical protein